MDSETLAKQAYHAYGEVTDFKNYQGLPMPDWNDLTPTIQQAWQAAATEVKQITEESAGTVEVEAKTLELDAREREQVLHALHYATHFSSAGVPGHGQFMLIARLAWALGIS